MNMKPERTKATSRKPDSQKTRSTIKDPIEVYCRIRPPTHQNDAICIRAKDSSTVVMTPFDNSLNRGTFKEVHYTFKHVFDENTSQKTLFDHSAFPLVEDLFKGANGLLFTYGITSSGKTHTMTGSPSDVGILPRTLDLIFRSIQPYQATKFVFKPDKMNGFDIQSKAEAFQDQHRENVANNRNKQKRKEFLGDWASRVPDCTIITDIDGDNNYAIFISYVEIYNNYIYDLLEDSTESVRPRVPQSKLLREDSVHNMYVFGVAEVEVKSADEALELFSKGQQRRRVSHTALNAESSRSHSVFTIRIAQAPLDSMGNEVLQDRNLLTISQLSMVDLAGSERSVRTRNTGQKLREAGNINTSLMTLRTCIEILRDNQSHGSQKLVPYRHSKLTFLFKTFFEGEGKIRMVVCVNPRADDYDETISVMKFAEMTQDVLIARTPVATPTTMPFRTGRGNLYREALHRAREEFESIDIDIIDPTTYNLGPDFPELIMNDPNDETVLTNLIEFLKAREMRRNQLQQELEQKKDAFRQNLIAVDKENISLKQENIVLRMDLRAREQQVKDLERKVSSSEESNQFLRQKLNTFDKQTHNLKYQVNERELKLVEVEKEREKMIDRMQDRIQSEKDRMKKLMERRLAEKQAELERKMCFNKEKFRQLRDILNTDDFEDNDFAFLMPNYPTTLPKRNPPETLPKEIRMTRAKTTMTGGKQGAETLGVAHQTKAVSDTSVDKNKDQVIKQDKKSVAVANPRHRRSHSSSGNVWLEHKPAGCLELGTVLQPKIKKKKSVSKLEVKDVTKNEVDKYVLTHQEQDSKGEVETQLYKGDVIPSAGGGAQVIFNDVEKLHQESPPRLSYNLRKRSAENISMIKVEDRCSTAVEGHGMPSKVMRRAK